MGRKTKQGIYKPKKPEKWIITESFSSKEPEIVYRSSWERRFAEFCDYNDNIIKVNSEGMVIPYMSPKDGKIHRYYMDFIIELNNKEIWLIEIKPYMETQPPKPPRKNTKNPQKAQERYIKALETYAVNQAKWESAQKFADSKGWKFKIITEYELGLKTKNL